MNILILNWKDIKNPEVGGAEILLYELAKRLAKEKHKVTWFCRKFSGGSDFDNIGGIEIVRRGNKFTVYLEAWKYYKNLKIKPDKIIESVNTICWQTPLYISEDKRIILVNQLAREVFFYELLPPLSYLAYFLESWEYKTYKKSKFLCYSKSVADDLKNFGIPSQNINNFSLGIDHSRYKTGKKSIKPIFIFVGRLARMKRADLCVKAMKEVCQKYNQSKLALIGYGPEEYNLKKLIISLGLQDNVDLVTRDNLYFGKDRKDVKVKLLQQAWAIILPSVKEGWGMVVTEAAACGTPAIVTNVSGLKDSVIDSKTGFIISDNPSVEELSQRMIKIIEDKKLRNRLSAHSVKWSNKFSWDRSYKEFCNLIT